MKRAQKTPKDNGFTLLELLAAMSIILALTATSIGSFKATNWAQENSTHYQEKTLNNALEYVKSLGSAIPTSKTEAILLISSPTTISQSIMLGAPITTPPPEHMTIGGTTKHLEFINNQFVYTSTTPTPSPSPSPSPTASPTPSPTPTASPTPTPAAYLSLEGVLIGGGNISNNAALAGSVVIVSTAGTQPSITFNNNASITGDVFAPGMPTVIGSNRIIDLDGDSSPKNYTILIEKGAVQGSVYRRINPITIPVVSAPTDLTERANQNSGHLTTGHYEKIAVPNHGTIVLGEIGATTPSVIYIDELLAGNGANIIIQGPVILNLSKSTIIDNNIILGNVDHPEWLDLRMVSGNLTVGNNGFLYGKVTSTLGIVNLENNSTFIGGIAAKYLNMSNNGTGTTFNMTIADLLDL